MKKSQLVKEWEESCQMIEDMAPKCCETCTHRLHKLCTHFKKEPPEYFLSKIDACKAWTRSPF